MPEFFRRIDERPDALFYRTPRGQEHLDVGGALYLRDQIDATLPITGPVLDLMSGRSSQFGHGSRTVVGLGLNAEELHANPVLDQTVIHDLNENPNLPFDDRTFEGAVCTMAVQYLTHPVDVFCDVGRVLAPGAPFIVAYSSRMYPEKAVLAWRASDLAAHERLVRSYFAQSGRFGEVDVRHHEPAGALPVTWLSSLAHGR